MNINSISSNSEHYRKIEDIIDVQKANGNFTVRKVGFKLLSQSGSTGSANLAKSLESGLSNANVSPDAGIKKNILKPKLKRHHSPIPDVVSWPSDSDITVLRMKLCLTTELKEKVANAIPGDGLHQPDSSSMINLATLMRQSQPPSKHSIMEEYLIPLTSWERDQETEKVSIVEDIPAYQITGIDQKADRCNPMSSLQNDGVKFHEMDIHSQTSTKSKIARFLRLYFCPCCRCLYKMENMSDDPSAYWERRKEQTL